MSLDHGLFALRAEEHRLSTGVLCEALGPAAAGDISLSGPDFAAYWQRKLIDPNFHSGSLCCFSLFARDCFLCTHCV